jgi:glycosyltransferase involved in cell wall biosynthesis
MKTFFISPKSFLEPHGGGVQWCTGEFLASIKGARFNPEVLSYKTPREPWIRLFRKILPIPFYGMISWSFKKRISDLIKNKKPKYIFLNNSESASLAPYLRNKGFQGKIIYLSHGVEITDVLNNLRLAPSCIPSKHQGSVWLGNLLKWELRIRDALDGVICVAETDLVFEDWLGAKKQLFLPRQILINEFKWNPKRHRVGVVATLNHGPNLHGLQVFGNQLKNYSKIEVRLVGGPEKDGRQLASQYKGITYLGPISNHELKKEAQSWCAFINPIFCYARGVSTKVATALGWGLPVFTTPMGARGYRWDEEALPFSRSPEELIKRIHEVSNGRNILKWANSVKKVIKLAPQQSEITMMIRGFCDNL